MIADRCEFLNFNCLSGDVGGGRRLKHEMKPDDYQHNFFRLHVTSPYVGIMRYQRSQVYIDSILIHCIDPPLSSVRFIHLLEEKCFRFIVLNGIS